MVGLRSGFNRFSVLAILGRGITQRTGGGEWMLTEDLELCDENSAHLAAYEPPDDSNPLCMIGGGELNLLAGAELYRRRGAGTVVCAYGDRSKYLKENDHPSESMVMSRAFQTIVPDANIKVWTKEMSMPGPANTRQELENIFNLAADTYGLSASVSIVTIDLHMPRTLVLAQRHLERPVFQLLDVHFYVSERVLAEADPKQFEPRRKALRESKSFERNWYREQLGIYRTLTDFYNDEKPLAAAR